MDRVCLRVSVSDVGTSPASRDSQKVKDYSARWDARKELACKSRRDRTSCFSWREKLRYFRQCETPPAAAAFELFWDWNGARGWYRVPEGTETDWRNGEGRREAGLVLLEPYPGSKPAYAHLPEPV